LGCTERRVQIREQPSRHAGPAMPAADHRFQLRMADLDQRKLRRHEEPIQHDQGDQEEELQSQRDDRIGIHAAAGRAARYNFTSPKMTRRISCNATIPTSCRSGASTIARRWPVRCIWRNATSKRVSSSKYNAGFTKSRAE